jgi:hypothetical protein
MVGIEPRFQTKDNVQYDKPCRLTENLMEGGVGANGHFVHSSE